MNKVIQTGIDAENMVGFSKHYAEYMNGQNPITKLDLYPAGVKYTRNIELEALNIKSRWGNDEYKKSENRQLFQKAVEDNKTVERILSNHCKKTNYSEKVKGKLVEAYNNIYLEGQTRRYENGILMNFHDMTAFYEYAVANGIVTFGDMSGNPLGAKEYRKLVQDDRNPVKSVSTIINDVTSESVQARFESHPAGYYMAQRKATVDEEASDMDRSFIGFNASTQAEIFQMDVERHSRELLEDLLMNGNSTFNDSTIGNCDGIFTGTTTYPTAIDTNATRYDWNNASVTEATVTNDLENVVKAFQDNEQMPKFDIICGKEVDRHLSFLNINSAANDSNRIKLKEYIKMYYSDYINNMVTVPRLSGGQVYFLQPNPQYVSLRVLMPMTRVDWQSGDMLTRHTKYYSKVCMQTVKNYDSVGVCYNITNYT